MEVREYLEALSGLLGGKVHQEEFAYSTLPHLSALYRGRAIRVDFVHDGELVLDVDVHPPHHLRVRPKGLGCRLLGLIGIRPGHRTGDAVFDDDYLIDDATAEHVAAFFVPEAIALLRRLEPFYRFQLTHKEYRCIKHAPDLQAFPPERAAEDINVMMEVVDRTSRADPPA